MTKKKRSFPWRVEIQNPFEAAFARVIIFGTNRNFMHYSCNVVQNTPKITRNLFIKELHQAKKYWLPKIKPHFVAVN